MSDPPSLPPDAVLDRTTPSFTAATVPAGLLGAHRIADGVWGVLRVERGTVTLVLEATGDAREVAAGESHVIEPGVAHHVALGDGARFAVEFHREAS